MAQPEEEGGQVVPTFESAEPSDELREQRERHYLGVFKFQLHHSLFDPNGDLILKEIAADMNFSEPRVTTDVHAERIKASFDEKAISSFYFPLVAALASDYERERATDVESENFTLNEASRFILTHDKHQAISITDSIKLQLILIDGRARMKVLLQKVSQEEEKEIFVEVYDSDVLKRTHTALLFQLLHGTNIRQSYSSLAVEPSLGDHLVSINLCRLGQPYQVLGKVSSEISSAFYSYASSHFRTRVALFSLSHPLIAWIVEHESKSRIASWFKSFGAASPIFFRALDDTVNAFKKLDPDGSIFEPTFYFYASKVFNKEKLENPFAETKPQALVDVRDRCRKLGSDLRIVLSKISPAGELQLQHFINYFGRSTPPWLKESDLNLSLAQHVFKGFKILIDRLETKVSKVPLEQEMGTELITYEDLIAFNPRGMGTAHTRRLVTAESHILSPLAELFAAYVQLARNDNSLQLPAQYWSSFEDPEPFFIELLCPGAGVKSIRATRRKSQIAEPWFEPLASLAHYTALINFIHHHHYELLVEILAAKARIASLDDTERSTLLSHYLDPSLHNTPQKEIIEQNLHLAIFKVTSDRSLVSTLPPPSYSRCVAWLRSTPHSFISPLRYKVDLASASDLFRSFIDLVEESDIFPVEESHTDLEKLVEDTILNNPDKLRHDDLPRKLDSAAFDLESLKSDTLIRQDLLAVGAGPDGNGEAGEDASEDEEEEEEEEENSDQEEEEEEREKDQVKGKKRKQDEIEGTDGDFNIGNVGGNGIQNDKGGEDEGKDDDSEGDENGIAQKAFSKPAKKKKKTFNPNAAYRPSTRKSRRQNLSSPASPALTPTSSLVLDDNVFADGSADQPSKTDLATWKSSRITSDPSRSITTFVELSKAILPLAFVIIQRFRQSNDYPPFGVSIDESVFVMSKFAARLEEWLGERADSEGEDDEMEEGEQVELNHDMIGLLWERVQCRVQEIVMEVLGRGQDDKVYQFLDRFAQMKAEEE